MGTQMELKVLFGRKSLFAARTFREKKEQQSRVFFDVIFNVYSHVDNREKELERVIEDKGDEFLWEKKKHENFIAAVKK